MKFSAVLFSYVILICGLKARADILFLDLNGSPKEVEAARKAAKARKEKLIVIPNAAQAAQYEAQKAKVNKQAGLKDQACVGSDPAACKAQTQKLAQERNILEQVATTGNLTKELLSKKLAELKLNKTNLTSMVISGHDGNGDFSGSVGDLTDVKIAEAFAANEPVGANLRSLMLWGCYTVNIGSLTHNWKKAFPQVEMIAGFDGSGPLADKPANWAYLSDVMIQEKKLTAIKDENELKKVFKKIDGVQTTNAAICVGEKWSNKSMALDLRDAQKLCGSIIKETQENYTCYLHAEKPSCANPPEDTQNSDLRSTYDRLQKGKHCEELTGAKASPDVPSTDTAIRLIYFDNVKSNYQKNQKIVIERMNGLLKTVNAPSDLSWGDLTKMNRAEVLAKIKKTTDFLDMALKENGPLTPEYKVLQRGLASMQKYLGDLRVDFNWTEPDATMNPIVAADDENAVSPQAVEIARKNYEEGRGL